MSVLAAVVSDPTPSLIEVRPDVPPELEAAIFKCLEKRPENRYQTVAEFAVALEPFAPPSAVPSIQRISGTLRASTPIRISGELPTLEAPVGSTPPALRDADTVQATPDSFPVNATPELLQSLRADSKTAAEWGKSTKSEERGRNRRTIYVAGGIVVGVALAGVLATTTFRKISAVPDGETQGSVTTPVSQAIPAANSEADSGVEVTATASSAPEVESEQPVAVKPLVTRTPTHHPPKPPKPPASAHTAEPPPENTTVHPLEGRR